MINKICNLIDKIPQKYFCGSTKQYNILQIIKNYTVCETSVFVVLPNLYEAQKYYDSLVNIMGVDKCLFFPVDQTLTHLTALGSIDFKFERLFTFRKLLSNEKYIIVTTVDGALFKTLSPQDYRNAVLSLTQNEKYNFNEIIEFLSISGFKKMPIVSNLGEYSVRGSIIDFFGINNSFPVRLDFAFDTLEQIKQFNIETQRSISILSNIEISPINELFYSSKLLYEALDRIDIFIKNKNLSDKEKDVLENDIIKLKNRHDLNKLLIYTVFFNDHSYNIFSFVNESKIFLLDFEKALINEQTETQNVNEFKDLLGSVVLSIEYKFSLHELINIASYIERKNSFNLGISEIKSFNNNYNLLIKYLKEWQNNTHLLFITDAKIYESVENKLKENNFTYAKEIKKNHICLLQSKIDIPFYSIYDKLHIIGDSCFGFKADTLVNYRSVINNSSIVKDTDELQINDYVVHYDYGIGQYKGLETIELNGRIRDYLSIEYQDTQILRVPVEQIDLVLKYSSYDGITPRLSKIGGKHWSVTKFNTVKKIKEQSDLLLELYVKRKNSIGYSFLPDKESETEIAKSFEYVESNDQLKAIEDVYYDMEQNIPMDRLIVGDVGFGKTEIALRASYKAVMSGKQVCYLAPTTVLARQHFYTFKNRMDELGVNIALLNRFVSAKEVKRIFDELEYGLIDIAIGTHKLLNPQVKFYNLGLLVIDEEQRFGVLHKEKIKNLKINVDTLTLSATPIPRTLQMANLGIRDFSRINTPPLNRYPIQTYVTPRNKIVIKEAIERELSRGGQVFYLYNKTKYIENITYELKKELPEARINYVHGQMNKNEIEKIINGFVNHKSDILVATTIIETGIDIPNTNTLIVHDADELGLSQLYQIRGRVGRTNKIAYCYLMYEPKKLLSEEAEKRLQAIEDFTDLGSGYRIALRDLQIRGAGDILGVEQTGFINNIGYDLYIRILNDVIKNNDSFEEIKKVQLDQVTSDRTINKDYINDDLLRIEVHRKIAKLKANEDAISLINELEDRFGKVSEQLIKYIYERVMVNLKNAMQIQNISKNLKAVKITFISGFLNEHRKKIINEYLLKSKYPFTFNQEKEENVLYFKNIFKYYEIELASILTELSDQMLLNTL